jgi:hypothetical protein
MNYRLLPNSSAFTFLYFAICNSSSFFHSFMYDPKSSVLAKYKNVKAEELGSKYQTYIMSHDFASGLMFMG